jgi:hypothetical protein
MKPFVHPLKHEYHGSGDESSSSAEQTPAVTTVVDPETDDPQQEEQLTSKTIPSYNVDIDNFLAVGSSADVKKSIQDLLSARNEQDLDVKNVLVLPEDFRARSKTFNNRLDPMKEMSSLERRVKSANAIVGVEDGSSSLSSDIDEFLALSKNRPVSANVVVVDETITKTHNPGFDVDFMLRIATESENGSKSYRNIISHPDYSVSFKDVLERSSDIRSSNTDIDFDPPISEKGKKYIDKRFRTDSFESPKATTVVDVDHPHADIDKFLEMSDPAELQKQHAEKRNSFHFHDTSRKPHSRVSGRLRSLSDFTKNARKDLETSPLLTDHVDKENKGKNMVQ